LVAELGLCENSMSFDNVLHSNLGGAGPDSGSADLTYASVLPESALALTRLQSRRSVTFLFENKAEFTVSAAERNYANPQGRNIFFTGASNLVCPREATCSTFVCPARMRQRQNAEFTVCASRPCTAADQDTCCIAGNLPRIVAPVE
jgi:hypothetical protein